MRMSLRFGQSERATSILVVDDEPESPTFFRSAFVAPPGNLCDAFQWCGS
jgi:hypothetical protein